MIGRRKTPDMQPRANAAKPTQRGPARGTGAARAAARAPRARLGAAAQRRDPRRVGHPDGLLEHRSRRADQENPFAIVGPQAVWGVAGAVLMIAIMRVDYRYLRAVSVPLFIVALGLLAVVLTDGIGPIQPIIAGGSSRWLQIGPLPAMHPAEFAKLALVIYLAHWLARRGGRTTSLSQGLLPFLAILGLVIVMVFLEPDLGTAGGLGADRPGHVLRGRRTTAALRDHPAGRPRGRGGRRVTQPVPVGSCQRLPQSLGGRTGTGPSDDPGSARAGHGWRDRHRSGPEQLSRALRSHCPSHRTTSCSLCSDRSSASSAHWP